MKEKLAKIREEILKQIDASENLDKLNEVRVSALTEPGTVTSSPFPVCPICVVLPYFGLTRRIPRNPIASHTSAFF